MSGPRLTAVLVLAAILCTVAAPVSGRTAKTILLLHVYGHDAPARAIFDAGFAGVLRDADDVTVDLYVETLDPNRFGGETQTQRTRAFLRARYADKKIDVVVAAYDRALTFLLDPRDPLFPGVPVAALSTGYPKSLPDHVALIWESTMIGQSAALALTLRPGVRRITLIDGAPPAPGSDAVYTEAQRQIEALAPGVPVVALRDLPLDELLARVRALPADTAIVIARQTIGRRGQTVSTADAITEVARVAPVPVFVVSDRQIGSGAVGGLVISIEHEGAQLAALALRLARHGARSGPPERSVPVPMFDWRALKRWGIGESLLPPGSVVLFRQPTFWDDYRPYIVGAAVILALQSALIAALLIQGRRRRRTETALRDNEQHLRRAVEQNQDLAGRLIDAQEQERTRIARDLHDDLSQQLAGLGIMLSALKRMLGTPGSTAEVERAVATLQDRAATLAQAVRSLSQELHPSVLQHTGLVAVLRRHCADVERDHSVSVPFSAANDLDALDPDTALCLFRVTQEALTNAVRHGRARTIDVQLSATRDQVELNVVDDGVGFISGQRAQAGLGLRSIDERVRLAHGRVTVESRPGQGTTVRVWVPWVAAPVVDQGSESTHNLS